MIKGRYNGCIMNVPRKTPGCRPSDGYLQAIPPKAKLCGISYSIRIPWALSTKVEKGDKCPITERVQTGREVFGYVMMNLNAL